MSEVYKTHFKGYYVSRDGRVWRDANRFDKGEGLIEVGQSIRGAGYLSVNISLRDTEGKYVRQKKYYVHRLIAETFIKNPDNCETVNHIDEDKKNNCVDNLEWMTHSENWRLTNSKLPKDSRGRWMPLYKSKSKTRI